MAESLVVAAPVLWAHLSPVAPLMAAQTHPSFPPCSHDSWRLECIKAVLWETALLFPASFSLLCEGLEPLGRQDIEHHLVADDLLDLSADVDSLTAEYPSRSSVLTLMMRPLMIWGVPQSIRPLIMPEPPTSPICPMDRGSRGALVRPIQVALGVHQPADAVRLRELALQFPLIEPLPLEDLHLLVHGGGRHSVPFPAA